MAGEFFRIGIVGHDSRMETAHRLFQDVAADYCRIDNGLAGCRGNHLAVWRWHAENPAVWSIVLEDDAQPVDGFREQLEAALLVAPTPIASFYLGNGYVYDRQMREQIRKAEKVGADWLVGRGRVYHAVALAVRNSLVDSMIAAAGSCKRPIDHSIGRWAFLNGYEVGYSLPSLVDHADQVSIVTPQRRRGSRRAWRVGTREQWRSKSIQLV